MSLLLLSKYYASEEAEHWKNPFWLKKKPDWQRFRRKEILPEVYEDEDVETETPFEEAWEDLNKSLYGEESWFEGEEGSPLWEALMRADVLSGIGSYGVLLLGVDDGQPLSQPVAKRDAAEGK